MPSSALNIQRNQKVWAKFIFISVQLISRVLIIPSCLVLSCNYFTMILLRLDVGEGKINKISSSQHTLHCIHHTPYTYPSVTIKSLCIQEEEQWLVWWSLS